MKKISDKDLKYKYRFTLSQRILLRFFELSKRLKNYQI